ncbi:MAG: rod shape-determining protein RodA [Pseudomonadota bacterium]
MGPLSSDFVRQMPTTGAFSFGGARVRRGLGLDGTLLSLLLCLTTCGLFVLYSASGQNLSVVYRQMTYLTVGYAGMYFISKMSLDTVRSLAPIIYGIGCLLLVLVLVMGVGAKGAQRWIEFGSIRFQPSEIMKLAVPLFVAWYLSNQKLPPSFGNVLVVLIIVSVPAGLIVVEPDLGTSILVTAAGLFVLWLAGLGFSYIAGALGVLAVSAYPIWTFFLRDYQKTRILTLFEPDTDRLGAGWNITQSKTAIGSGGFTGKGWLDGTQSHLDFLPESHTDFIVAVLAEEYGLIGVTFILGLYVAIFLRGFYLSWKSSSLFGQLIGGAIMLTFFTYVLVNMGMVSGILPVVGVPLPLVSQGGTSVVSLLIAFGVLMLVAKNRRSLNS